MTSNPQRPRARVARGLASATLACLAAGPLLAQGEPTGVHAITGARLVLGPGRVVASGTVVIRDGLIEAVGADVQAPPDARLWPGEGLTVYPGLVEAYAEPRAKPSPEPRRRGARPTPRPTPEPEGGGAGHPLPAVRAERRVVEGPPPAEERRQALREAGFAAAQVVPTAGVLRGASAVLGLGDGDLGSAVVAPDAAQVVAFETTRGRYPGSSMGAVATVRQALSDARWYGEARSAWRGAPAGTPRPPLNLAWEALQPLVGRRQPALFVAGDMLDVLRAARLAREASVDAYVLSAGDGYKRAGLLAETRLPLVVPVDFPEAPEIESPGDELELETVDLRHWQNAPGNPAALERAGITFALTSHGLDDPRAFRGRVARALARGLSPDAALAAVTTVPARLLGVSDRLGTLAPGRIANLTVVRGELFSADDPLESVWVDGRRYAPEERGGKRHARGGGREKEEQTEEKDAGATEAKEPIPAPEVAGDPEAWRAPRPAQPAALLVRNATVWTAGPRGTLEGADLLVRSGRIEAVGAGLEAPPGAQVIDAGGRHVTPGLIDAHSHAAVEGGVNECTDAVTAEVRIGDVLNPESVEIYRLLAGGTTVQHLLHGSCNPIGGQSAIIKNRWGAAPAELLFEGAPPTIKFALGENPKRAGGDDRYPRSRGGVEQVIRRAFAEARDYQAAKREHASGARPLAPRPDLRLESVSEILAGERQIHSHAYRQSEMLMLMRVADDYRIRVRCFQHVLEGYKIADELAAHGTCASGFSDWWAYKFEVYDAIPYSAFLMWERGVSVSFNSDSAELARRLNAEAAKAVRYGGVPPEEALRFVTLNPARQLGIDDRVGSLEPGKDADFVIWNGSPLSTYARVDETWVDGRRYFDRAADLAGRDALEQEREALLARARDAAETSGARGGGRSGRRFLYLEAPDVDAGSCLPREVAAQEDIR